MTAIAKASKDSSPKPVLLHLLGGSRTQGGMLTYARQLVREEMPSFEQRIWKYRGYRPENDKFVCLGRAKTLDANLFADLTGAALDFWPLCRWLRNNPNAILYAHNRPNAILAALMRLLYNVPVLVHVHTLGQKRFLNRVVWRMAKATVIFNSRLSSQHFNGPTETANIHEPPIQWPKHPAASECRLVAAGAIQKVKNIHLIIDAFNLAGESAPRTLHIYGLSTETFEPAYQRRIIAKAKQNPRICLHNWDEHWTDSLNYNDIFIHARDMEPFGIVMLEAFAKGCRMVVPRHTFLNELSPEGIFFADLTTESLAKSLAQANAYRPNADLWESRRIYEERYSVKGTIQRLHSLLCSLAKD